MMNIRLNNTSDQRQIRTLWEEIFPEDSKEYLDFYFDVVMEENQVVVVEDTSKDSPDIVAMLHLNPYLVCYNTKVFKVYYIVAVATKPEYRRQGLMRKMLDYAEQVAREQKVDYLVLLPADERYYRPFGYHFVSKQYNTTIYTENYSNEANKELYRSYASQALTYSQFEDRFLHTNIDKQAAFSPKRTSDLAYRIYQETRAENGQIYEVEGNLILLYEYDENGKRKIEVRKIYYNKDRDDTHMNYETIKAFLLTVAQGSPLLIHEAQTRKVTRSFAYNRKNNYDCRPYMMMKTIGQGQENIDKVYFDEMV